jgi:hypothetical protein|tara:strand:+ start:492 stop:809 length:318 start_codon:yes stop_codon:yes gene_type:complete
MPRSYEPGVTPNSISGSDEYIVANGTGTYFGCALHETGGSNPATITVTDKNASTAGETVDIATLAASGATFHWASPQGVAFVNGLHIDVGGSGTLAGTVYYLSDQ